MTDMERAEKHTIIRVPVGSTIHGLHLDGTDDRDEMGVCIEDLVQVAGFNPFEQFIYRTAAEREHKHDAPSQPGDLDLTIYSMRKFLRLAMHGNPTVLNLLFVPQSMWVSGNANGLQLQELAPLIVSRQAGKRYLGYLEAQRQRLLGERGQKRSNRPELEEKYGFDTKYAMHIVRLGYQGVELLETGKITFPMAEPTKSHIRSIRVGKVPLHDILTEAGEQERRIKDLIDTSPLREFPTTELVEKWMVEKYFMAWRSREIITMEFQPKQWVSQGE